MDVNLLETMVLPVVAGLCLGTALGAFGLAVIRTVDGIAGLGRRAASAPSHPARWHPIVVGLGPHRARLRRH